MKKNKLSAFIMLVVCIGIYAFLYFRWSGGIPLGEARSNPSIEPASKEPRRPQWWGPKTEVPEGYEQIVMRGAILAVDDPEYVSASEAKILDDTPVLGVVVEGKPLAYSLNLLNNHEVVNDTIGSTNFACVW